MIDVRFFGVVLAGACVLAAGCVDADGHNMFGEDAFDVPLETMDLTPPIGGNGYKPSCFWTHGVQQTYRDLAGGALANQHGYLPYMPHLSASPVTAITGCRHEALKYLIGCALRADQSVMDHGTGRTYYGHFGLVSRWRDQALTSTDDKEWMTSCLLQHLNGYGSGIDILLEADRFGFYYDSTLHATFKKRESIAWGNLFDSTQPLDPLGASSNLAFEAHACHYPEVDSCNGGGEALKRRVCDTTGLCGLQLEGLCPYACVMYSNTGGYWNCDDMKSFSVRVGSFATYGDGDKCAGP